MIKALSTLTLLSISILLIFNGCKPVEKNNKEKAVEVKTSPCDIPYVEDPIIRSYLIGMVMDENGGPKDIEFPYKTDSANVGQIKFSPVWEQDTLVEVKVQFTIMKGSAEEVMKGALKNMMKERKYTCENIPDNSLPDKVQCGRTIISIFPSSQTITFRDACRDLRR
jgi:hypothetical protein